MYDFVSLNLKCPICGVSLMNREKVVDKKPSIHLNIRLGEEQGSLYLSSLYGSYSHECDLKLNQGQIVRFFCPHCRNEIISKNECRSCGAPIIPLYLDMGGKVSICSRNGCKNHFVEFEDLNLAMQKLYEDYEIDDTVTRKDAKLSRKDMNPEKETVLNIYCPLCRKSLQEMDQLKLQVRKAGVTEDILIPTHLLMAEETHVLNQSGSQVVEDVFCGYCKQSLMEKEKKCEKCGSAVASVLISTASCVRDLHFCTRLTQGSPDQ